MEAEVFDPTKFQPISNHVLVRRRKGAEKTTSGLLHLPETGKSPSELCDVLAAGPGYHEDNGFFQKTEIVAGDVVLIPLEHGHEFTVVDESGEEQVYVTIREKHILAKIEEAA